MREIAFRAWIGGKVNKMVSVHGIHFILNEIFWQEFQKEGKTNCSCKINEYITLMQYTGLKDKNGKEIYEGDVVQFHFNKNWCKGDYLPQERFEVTLENFRKWCKGEKFGYEGELLLSPDDCEVIGNIYESPELLSDL